MKMPFRRLLSLLVLVLSVFLGFPLAAAEYGDDTSCSVETSVWMIANVLPDPPDFYQLCLGYQVDEKSVLLLNGITWKYGAPIGIPMNDPQFEDSDEEYPGYVRSFGLGVGYQRFIWNGLYASLHAIPFMQNFYTNDDRLLQTGFQLYLQGQLGYHIGIFKSRFFIKPALYLNYWPVNTNVPDGFQEKDKDWPKYNFEPHLNIGFRF